MTSRDEHPSKEIVGTRSEELRGKKIVLCITGSVAAMHSPELARELMREGADVHCVMSQAACEIIHPYLMEWATGNPVTTKLTGAIEHVALITDGRRRSDLVLVAPATANTIGKIAAGIDDTPVTSLVSNALGVGVPIIIAPAAHEGLYTNPMVESATKRLQSAGVTFVGPVSEQGKAKMAGVPDIIGAAIGQVHRKDMVGLNVLVTAGPTVEYLDPVRVLTNKSSGRMGIAMAEEAHYRGANVAIVMGPTHLQPKVAVDVHRVETGEEMLQEVTRHLKSMRYDVFVGAAAVSDFRPVQVRSNKIRSHGVEKLTVTLRPTVKVIREAKRLHKDLFIVGFKAEHGLSEEQLAQSARSSLGTLSADVVIANDVSRTGVGFGMTTNEVLFVDRTGRTVKVGLAPKETVAHRCWDIITPLLKRRS